jgi:enoyl-CoA hydratase/carnithine racemase
MLNFQRRREVTSAAVWEENRTSQEDIGVTRAGAVAVVELRRPPNNFMNVDLVADLVTILEGLERDAACRSVVLAATGEHFCAGGNLKQRLETEAQGESFVPLVRHV